MKKPKVIVLSGYGLNCEEETAYAFFLAGAESKIIHVNDLINGLFSLKDFQILAIPGGFSFGDDTGSGNAFALRLKNHLWEEILNFIEKDRLIIGICNGFQILVNLGVIPAVNKKYGERQVTLTFNRLPRYLVRWVDLKIKNKSPWFCGIEKIYLPIAHGEGRFLTTKEILNQLKQKNLIAAQYFKGEICTYLSLPANPNGSLANIAAISDETGRILGMMPHPERAIFFHHLPHWPYLKEKYQREGKKIPKYGPGLKIFQNAVAYFQ